MSLRYRINEPNVISETIENEVIIINLDVGIYYSLTNTGAAIWAGLMDGASQDDLIARLRSQYDAEPAVIEAAVPTFLDRLVQEQLIVPVTDSTVQSNSASPALPDLNGNRAPFEPPHLHKYTDMQDLLLLDPIHDVDQTGWPNIPQDTGEEG